MFHDGANATTLKNPSVTAIAWTSSSGTLEAAVDRQQFEGAVGSKFKAQVFAQGSYDETRWFPETQGYLVGAQPATTSPSQQPTQPPSVPGMDSTMLIIGAVVAVIVVTGAAIAVSRRRK